MNLSFLRSVPGLSHLIGDSGEPRLRTLEQNLAAAGIDFAQEKQKAKDAGLPIPTLAEARAEISRLHATANDRAQLLAQAIVGKSGEVDRARIAALENDLSTRDTLIASLQSQLTVEGRAGELEKLRGELETMRDCLSAESASRTRAENLVSLLEGAVGVRGVDPAHAVPAINTINADERQRLVDELDRADTPAARGLAAVKLRDFDSRRIPRG